MAHNAFEVKAYGTESGDNGFAVLDDGGTQLFAVDYTEGNVTIAGTLAVTGAQTFTGTAGFQAVTVATTLAVTGIATHTAAIQAATAQHLSLNTQSDDKQVRINSRNFTQATGSSIGFQAKPAQTVTSTGSVIGGEISPRVNSAVEIASVIGLHVDAYLKGTAAGTVSGDVRGLQIEMVTDDAGTRTVGGDVTGLRFRTAFSATTITGKMCAIKIEKPETQTNSKTYDYILDLTSTNGLIWADDYGTEVTTLSGAIKVRVNGADRWLPLYSGAPSV